jgi:aspartate kinase
MIVMKFGGSSIKDAMMIKKTVDIIKNRLDQKPVIVLSAIQSVTDNLIKSLDESTLNKFDSYEKTVLIHKNILKKLDLSEDILDDLFEELKNELKESNKQKKSLKLLDYISFFGERLSVTIISKYLDSIGIKSKALVSGDIGLVTDSNFGDARVLEESYENIHKNLINLDFIPVITGFGGKDKYGNYVTLNRGGSDYVASVIGAAVGANEIQIWTDVDGIMSTDPAIVKNTISIPELTFNEASDLAYFGARVLHPRTILPAISKNIPVLVLNTFNPEHKGSKIVKESALENGMIKAISYKKNITIIDIKSTRMFEAYGYLEKIFQIFNKYKKSVDMITTSEIKVSVTIDSKDNLDKILSELNEIASTTVHEKKAILYVVGKKMKDKLGAAGEIFSILGKDKIKIEMISQCANRTSIGFVVSEENVELAVRVLHKNLIKNY